MFSTSESSSSGVGMKRHILVKMENVVNFCQFLLGHQVTTDHKEERKKKDDKMYFVVGLLH